MIDLTDTSCIDQRHGQHKLSTQVKTSRHGILPCDTSLNSSVRQVDAWVERGALKAVARFESRRGYTR